ALGKIAAAGNVVVGVAGVVGGQTRDRPAAGGNRRQTNPRPVLPKILGEIQAIDVLIGANDQRVEPTLILKVLDRIAGECWIGQHDASLGAVGRVGGCGDGNGGKAAGVILNQRIANAAEQLVPDAAAVGAEEDAFAAESGVEILQ